MTGILNFPRAAMLVAVLAALLVLAATLARPAVAQTSDDCPAPKVGVVNATSAGDARSPQHAEAIINDAIESNKGSVRFFQSFKGGAIDVDYTLTVTGGTGDDGAGSSASLDDQKGRNVASGSGAAADLASQLSPMLDKIRDHQRRIRDQEKSAIAPEMTLSPRDTKIKVGETASITIEIVDCDGETLVREVRVQLKGSGDLTPRKLQSADAAQYKSAEPGIARVTGIWKYENVAGLTNVATKISIITVTGYEATGTGAQAAARPKGTTGFVVTDEDTARSDALLERSRQLMDLYNF